jgi:hypothetical protein
LSQKIEKYLDEINYLLSLGYSDRENNINVLSETSGNLEEAIDLLTGHPHYKREKDPIKSSEK